MTERLGDYLPSHIIESQIFVEGGAFLKKKHQFGNESPKSRCFFILNKTPQKDNEIITVHPTTQIEGRKAARPPEVLVEIKAGEFDAIKQDSIVDCDSYKVWNKSHIRAGIKDRTIEALHRLPSEILGKLKKAV